MNIRWFFILFLLLCAIITIYPPYYWDTSIAINDDVLIMQLPIKQHSLLFGSATKDFQLKHYPDNTKKQDQADKTLEKEAPDLSSYSDEELKLIVGLIPLSRKIATVDIALEYFVALLVSLLFAFVTGKKKSMNI